MYYYRAIKHFVLAQSHKIKMIFYICAVKTALPAMLYREISVVISTPELKGRKGGITGGYYTVWLGPGRCVILKFRTSTAYKQLVDHPVFFGVLT